MVQVNGVSKHYGAVCAVDRVELAIHHGELFGLIGHNGAGKTTLFKMLLGLTPAGAGSIEIDGCDVAAPGFRAVRRAVGYLPENVVLYDNLTGLETLAFFARLKHCPTASCGAALERVGLAQAASRRVREYSKGMRQRLGFAQALLGEPRILFLDEPTNGLDPEAIRDFYSILRGLRDQGVTVVLTSHILAEIQERVDRLAIMTAGHIRALGTVGELRDRINLPLRIEARIREGAGAAIRASLEHLPLVGLEQSGAAVVITCRRDLKMPVIGALLERGLVDDLHVHEPSLEDVFFGFSA